MSAGLRTVVGCRLRLEGVLDARGIRCARIAGMQLGAAIVEGKRTVLQYLLSSVQRVTDEAGRDR
jgi:hypothetical protein